MDPYVLRLVSRGKTPATGRLEHLPKLWLRAPVRVELACAGPEDTQASLDDVGTYSLAIHSLDADRKPVDSPLLWYQSVSPAGNTGATKGPHAVFEIATAAVANITEAGDYWIAVHAHTSGERLIRAAGYLTFVDDGYPNTPPTPTPPGTVYLTQAAGDARYVKDPGTVVDNTLARWDGISGGSVQGSAVTVNDSGDLTTPGTVEASILKIDSGTHEGVITAELLTNERTFELPDSSSTVLAATTNSNGAPDRMELRVKCDETGGVTLGQAVYIYGANGGNKLIRKAIASGEATSSKTIGLVSQALAHNAFGYVVTEGRVAVSIAKGSAVEGDPVWLSPATAGGIVFGLANKPSAPNHMVFVGYITRITGNNVTEIFVRVQNGFELEELHNVAISTPSTGHVLTWNGTLWVNSAPSGGGSVTVTGQDGIGVAGSPGTSITLSLGNITPDALDVTGTTVLRGAFTMIHAGDLDIAISAANLTEGGATVYWPGAGGNLATVAGTNGAILASDVTDGTTVGRNLMQLADPGAITFLRVNAANTVTARSAADFRDDLGLGTLATQSGTFSGTSSGTNTGDQTITLTGDVTGSGTGSFAATIAASAVTYAKMQAVSAVSRLLGRGTAGGTAVREVSLGTGLSMSGDVLSATTTGGGTKALPSWSARDNQPPATAFATIDTRNGQYVLDFDDGAAGANERAVFAGIIPAEFSLTGGFKVRVHWWATSINTAHRVKWTAEVDRRNTDASTDSGAWGSIHSALGPPDGTQFKPTFTEITLTSIDGLVAGEPFRLRITRDAADSANDTMSGDAELFGVQIIGN